MPERGRVHEHVVVEVEHFDSAMGLVADRLAALEGTQLRREDVAKAVGEGIAQAFANPSTWCGAGEGLKKAAENQAGSWLVSVLMRWLLRVLFLAVGGVIVYQLGGWSALLAVWKSFGGSST